MKLNKYRVTLIILFINLIIFGFLIKLTLNSYEISKGYSNDINDIKNKYNNTINDIDKRLFQLGNYIPDKFANFDPADPKTYGVGFPDFELWVDKNGTVNRTAVNYPNCNITLVCALNGEIFLERNANGETQYTPKYNYSGVYTFYLKSYIDGEYRVVSNVIYYTI